MPQGDSTKPRLLEQVRQSLRLQHYSYRTEEQYLGWIRRFIFFHTSGIRGLNGRGGGGGISDVILRFEAR